MGPCSALSDASRSTAPGARWTRWTWGRGHDATLCPSFALFLLQRAQTPRKLKPDKSSALKPYAAKLKQNGAPSFNRKGSVWATVLARSKLVPRRAFPSLASLACFCNPTGSTRPWCCRGGQAGGDEFECRLLLKSASCHCFAMDPHSKMKGCHLKHVQRIEVGEEGPLSNEGISHGQIMM